MLIRENVFFPNNDVNFKVRYLVRYSYLANVLDLPFREKVGRAEFYECPYEWIVVIMKKKNLETQKYLHQGGSFPNLELRILRQRKKWCYNRNDWSYRNFFENLININIKWNKNCHGILVFELLLFTKKILTWCSIIAKYNLFWYDTHPSLVPLKKQEIFSLT